MMQVVSLIGYRGSGKSSVAPHIAKALACDWIDSDREIEKRDGRRISQIFAESGEAAFRKLEHDVLNELLQSECLVIATGGGAILDERTRQSMRNAGPVVWLQASIDTLLERINADENSTTQRPSLTEQTNAREEIVTVLNRRMPLYDDASTLVVDTEGKSPNVIAAEIVELVATSESGGAS